MTDGSRSVAWTARHTLIPTTASISRSVSGGTACKVGCTFGSVAQGQGATTACGVSVVGNIGPTSRIREVSIGMAQAFRPGDPFYNYNTDTEYGLDGRFIFVILPGSDVRGMTNPGSIMDDADRWGRDYLGY